MPLKPLPYRIVKKKLLAAGFAQIAQEGSHVKFARETPDGMRTAIVPQHHEMAIGTLRSIIRQAGISPEEWEGL